MKTSIGGDRIGSGNKQDVHLKNFGRSSHDMGYTWRSTLASGTLTPFINEIGLPGDSFDINLNAEILTLPTVGPLFGSYKVQLDVFSCPIRLYNRELHMNKLGIGMDMSAVKLPQVRMTAKDDISVEDYDNNQIDPSCIWSHLGIRGLGRELTPTGAEITRDFLAVPYLCYWDVVKQYYSNKQENEGVVIHAGTGQVNPWTPIIATLQTTSGATKFDISESSVNMTMSTNSILIIDVIGGQGRPKWEDLKLNREGSNVEDIVTQYDDIIYTNEANNVKRMTCTGWTGGSFGAVPWQMDNMEAIGGTIEPDGKPELTRFPLKNIDEMRENILTQSVNGAPFTITQNSASPYGLSLTQSQVDGGTLYAKQFTQEGLAVKTYQSDLFNNWISTEWIDGDNGINAVTAVSTADGSFTIDALNIANKVYNMLNRIAISGGTYDDWLDAVYTHKRNRSVENPVYMGSLIKTLSFQEVVSTGYARPHEVTPNTPEAIGGNPLGSLAGRGQMTGKNKGGRIKIKVDEPSVILGLISLTPLIDYSQGNKWHMSLKNMNDFHKPSLDSIGYQDLITDQIAWFDSTIDTDGTIAYKSAGKQPAWINYMTNVNVIRGDFAKINNSMYMVLNRRYERGLEGIADLTTYIDPSKFNHIFADTRLDAQNFWAQIRVDMIARRKMSAKVIPNL